MLKGKFLLERNIKGENLLIYKFNGTIWNVALLSNEGMTLIPFCDKVDFPIDKQGCIKINKGR